MLSVLQLKAFLVLEVIPDPGRDQFPGIERNLKVEVCRDVIAGSHAQTLVKGDTVGTPDRSN